jgi:hypothetical protein
MSTKFGIRIESIDDTIEVAHRHNIGKGEVQIDILNPLLYLVRNDTKVIPLDNSAQGIETVNDIFNCKNIFNSW